MFGMEGWMEAVDGGGGGLINSVAELQTLTSVLPPPHVPASPALPR